MIKYYKIYKIVITDFVFLKIFFLQLMGGDIMNDDIKKEIIENEYKLIKIFPSYKQSINQFIQKLYDIKNDYNLYSFITTSFSRKINQVREYNEKGYKSSKQIIDEKKLELNMKDKALVSSLVEGNKYSSMEICAYADNYNILKGMYYLENVKQCIIKATINEENNYANEWIEKGIVIKYYMQEEQIENKSKLVFSHAPNRIIFESLMSENECLIHLFSRKNKGEKYTYSGVFCPCSLVENNTAFILYKLGYEEYIPFDDLEKNFLNDFLSTEENSKRDLYLISMETFPSFEPSLLTISKKKIKFSKRNYLVNQKNNMEVGLRGEELVMFFEKHRLLETGRKDLADLVEHVSLKDDSLGYDIKSFEIDSNGQVLQIFIEVKTTVCKPNSDFFITANELEKSKEYGDSYWIYRVYDIYSEKPKCYKVSGGLTNHYELIPTGYIARLK